MAGAEACDDGNLIQTDACLNDCMLAVSGDGCSSTCQSEAAAVPAFGSHGLVALALLLGATALAHLRRSRRPKAAGPDGPRI